MTYLANLENAATIPATATHAELDELHISLCLIPHRGRREKLADRRAFYAIRIARKIAIELEQIAIRAERAAFIGPRTTQDANGHPF
jgi:hypothetical protein